MSAPWRGRTGSALSLAISHFKSNVVHGFAAGAPATAVVRPEDVELSPDAATASLRGTVVDTYFLGGASTISVEVPGVASPILASVHGASRLARGDAVGVRFGRAAVVAHDVPAASAADSSESRTRASPEDWRGTSTT